MSNRESLMNVEIDFQRVQDLSCEEALIEIARFGEPVLAQGSSGFSKNSDSFVWTCWVTLSIKIPGVNMKITSERVDTPSKAARDCLSKCKKAIAEINDRQIL